jgi:mannose-6-phosphate isomerase
VTSVSDTRNRLVTWLEAAALPTWWRHGADDVAGGYFDRVSWALTPTVQPKRLRVQARQVFVYAAAGLMGWSGPWGAAVDHGLNWIDAQHLRPDGLYRAFSPHPEPAVDEGAHLYDQAFALLALSLAVRSAPSRAETLGPKAQCLAHRIREVFAHSQGGFRAYEAGSAFQADPIMHLFEASLAWLDVDPSPVWQSLAAEIATHFLDRMLDRNRPQIREEFEADWSPKAGPGGQVIEPGHQFEWAWLLGRWATPTGDARARMAAEGLYRTGLTGVDAATGYVLDELTDEGAPTGPMARLWPQAERLRAVLMFETEPEARRAAVHRAATALEAYFTKDPPGLWRDSRPDLHIPEEAALASSFYHIVGAIWALHAAA